MEQKVHGQEEAIAQLYWFTGDHKHKFCVVEKELCWTGRSAVYFRLHKATLILPEDERGKETCCCWWWWKREEKRLIIHDGILRYIYMNDRDGNTCDSDIINDLIRGLEHSGVIRSSLDRSTGRSHHGSAIRAIHVWHVIVLSISRHIWCRLWWDMWHPVKPSLRPVSTNSTLLIKQCWRHRWRWLFFMIVVVTVGFLCDDLPIPTLFFLLFLSSPVLNMTLNCINYALCFMTTTDTWNKTLVKIPWYRYNSWTWTTTYNSRTIKVHGPPLPTRRPRKVRLPTTRKDAN